MHGEIALIGSCCQAVTFPTLLLTFLLTNQSILPMARSFVLKFLPLAIRQLRHRVD
jgi:branched-subunit amino acid transport protein